MSYKISIPPPKLRPRFNNPPAPPNKFPNNPVPALAAPPNIPVPAFNSPPICVIGQITNTTSAEDYYFRSQKDDHELLT